MANIPNSVGSPVATTIGTSGNISGSTILPTGYLTANQVSALTNAQLGAITSSGMTFYHGHEPQLLIPEIQTSAVLPIMTFVGHDEAKRQVKLTLSPERSISPFEVLQLMMMITSYNTSGSRCFCPLAFVKANNLERHFKFE